MVTGTKRVTKLKFRVRINVEKDEPGYYAYAPSFKGLHTGGDTPEEALGNAKEAASLFLKSMLKHGEPIPVNIYDDQSMQREIKSKDILLSEIQEIQIVL